MSLDIIKEFSPLLNQGSKAEETLVEAFASKIMHQGTSQLAEAVGDLEASGIDPHDFIAKPPSVMRQQQRQQRLDMKQRQQEAAELRTQQAWEQDQAHKKRMQDLEAEVLEEQARQLKASANS